MENEKYTIDQLSELTGFTRRTIRYYIQEGLLEPPAGRGRGGFYYDSHLQRLLHIKALVEKGMSLSAVLGYLKSSEEKTEDTVNRQVWAKYSIVSGLEVHVRRDLEEDNGKQIAETLKIVKAIFKEKSENGK